MAVQNHDAALSEKEQLELNLKRSKGMVNNLQERVRQLEAAVPLEGQASKAWSLEELQLVQHAFEKSKNAITDIHCYCPRPSLSSAGHGESNAADHNDGASHAQALVASSVKDAESTFRSDHFCTWLTTDADAKAFGVNCRVQAVACGAALLAHKVTIITYRTAFSLLFCHRECRPYLPPADDRKG
jgi:hypothetical protein